MEENQEKVWDEIAENWDEYRDEPMQEVLDFMKDKEGKVIDIACGSGRNFTNQNCEYYGIDFSDNMLNLAEKKGEERDIECILVKSVTHEIPFDNSFFDHGLFIAALHCIPDKDKREKSLKEMRRVMKKGSKGLISVWSKNHNRVKGKGKVLHVPWSVGTKKVMRYYYIYDKEELEQLMKYVGFKVIKIWEDENIFVIVKK